MQRRPRLRVSRRGRLWLPELALAPGPVAESVTGDGTLAALFGTPWALLWDTSVTELMLARETSGEWVEVEPLAPLPALSAAARHITLCFDRSARPVIAWHVAGAGVYVRQYDVGASEYAVRGPFPGVDPVLVFDALAADDLSGADALLVTLDDDRARLLARIERDTYEDEYQIAELTAPVAGGAWYLDQVTIVGQRLQYVIASDAVDPSTVDLPRSQWRLERLTLHGELYPFLEASAAAATIATLAGRMDATTEVITAAEAAVSTIATLAGRVDATTEVITAAEAAVSTIATLAGRVDATTEVKTGEPEAAVAAIASLAGEIVQTTDALVAAEAAAATLSVSGRIDNAA